MLAATGGGTPPASTSLEVSPRQPVLAFKEECPRQFEAYPHRGSGWLIRMARKATMALS